jgi:lipopolysaccharide export system protein LptA
MSVPDSLVTSSAPGLLTVMKGDATTGTVTWEKGARLDLAKNTAFFEGNVNANFSGAILKSQKLTLEFDKAKKLRHIWAEGDRRRAHGNCRGTPPKGLPPARMSCSKS